MRPTYHSSRHIPVNFLYFGCLFFALLIMSLCSLLPIASLDITSGFFFLYAMGQALLEVTLFVFLGWILEKYVSKIAWIFFIGFTFVVLLFHMLDFFMNRILDLSLWQAIMIFVIYEDINNFPHLLDASGIPLWIWGLGFISFLFIPWVGWFFYRLTARITTKSPLLIKQQTFVLLFSIIPTALLLWDVSIFRTIPPDAYTDFTKSLPWKHTFCHPQNLMISLPSTIKLPPSEEEIRSLMAPFSQTLAHRPNIYLFMIESLREDIVTAQIAPHLSQFRDQNIHFPMAVSNGNGSHLSWFSTFHSQFPYYWSYLHDHPRTMGSPPLQLLQQLGYKIHVYSSAQLAYYNMEQVLFRNIPDTYTHFHHSPHLKAWQTDQATLQRFTQEFHENSTWKEGQIFIFFWDATHFDYSWPKDHSPPFTPISKGLSYFRAYQSPENIELIKNRYRNAVHYVDSLFGQFATTTPALHDSIVIVLGDHGEEFLEEGHLFHNSHLVKEQFHIPLYFHFPASHPIPPSRPIVSQIDIFPSILDYLTGQVPSFLQGESIFRPSQWPYALIARFNGGRMPYEFCFHNGTQQLTLRFANQSNPFNVNLLRIISCKSCPGKPLRECQRFAKDWIHQEFAGAWHPLVTEKVLSPDDAGKLQSPPSLPYDLSSAHRLKKREE